MQNLAIGGRTIGVAAGGMVRPGPRYRSAIAAILVIALALLGGASRAEESQQWLVRLAAIAVIAASLWPLDMAPLRRHWPLPLGFALICLLPLLQLVPLPPELWASLPGHAVYAQIAAASGTIGWRPLSLTPDMTENAIEALLPVAAAGLAWLYVDGPGQRRLAEWMVAVACASALLGLAQLIAGGSSYHLYEITSLGSPVGLLANRNHQAALLACALPLMGAAAGLRARHGDRRPAIIALLLVVPLLLLMLVSTGSRMGLVLGAMGLGGLVVAWRASGQPLLPPRGRLRLIALGSGLGLAAMVIAAAIGSGAVSRLAATDPADETRAQALAPILATARAFMPLGAGLGSFEDVYRRFEPDALLSSIYLNQAHDEPLEYAIEGGVPALILLGLFGLWWIRTAWALVRQRESVTRRTLGLACMAVTMILMLSSLVDYPLRTPLLGGLFAMACVSMARAAAARREGGRYGFRPT